MRINANIPGMRILDQMNQNNRRLNKAVERLSTGLRVNSAADDPVAMARGQRLTSEIAEIRMSMLNIDMEQGMLKTADGALSEVQSVIHRMRELALHAASDTITDDDREYIQCEIEELSAFVEEIVGNSKFNEIKLFQSDLVGYFELNEISKISSNKLETEELKNAIGELVVQNASVSDIYSSIFGLLENRLQEKIESGELPEDADEDISFDRELVSVKILKIDDIDLTSKSSAEKNLQRMNEALSRVMSYEAVGNEEALEIETLLSANLAMNDISLTLFDAFEKQEAERVKALEKQNEEEDDRKASKTLPAEDPEANAILDKLSALPELNGVILNTRAVLDNIRYGIAADDEKDEDAQDKEIFTTTKISGGLDMSTRENAAKSISLIDGALSDVSKERASIGAKFNALEHRKSALEAALITAEETKSRLLDADIAEEMMIFTKLSLSNQINGMLLKQTTDMQAQALNLFM